MGFYAPFSLLNASLGDHINFLLQPLDWVRDHIVPDSQFVVRRWE